MNRREILKLTALATGVAVSAPLLSTLLSGCQTPLPDKDADYKLAFFNKEEFSLVRDLVDTILPKTDSPAASDVGVHRMIDNMVGNVYEGDNQSNYKKGFTALYNHLSGKEVKNPFSKMEAKDKLAAIKGINDSSDEAMKDTKKALLDLRQQTVAYYLSTEEIAKNYLTYLPVPGEYQPCITLEEAGGKAWAI